MKKLKTPSQLLCEAIFNKYKCYCSSRPKAFILVPSTFLRSDAYYDYITIEQKLKIYIELIDYDRNIYHKSIFLITISHTTDYTNIVRDEFFVNNHDELTTIDEHHAFSNIYVSTTQVKNFVKEFITYLHFGELSLNTISEQDSCRITISSMIEPPSRSSFTRWVSLARI